MATIGVAALVLAGPAGAADIFEKVGTFDGQFLKINVGARAEGMGGAFVGVADDATALYWNAAGIARIESNKSELSLNHANWPSELSFDQVGYVFHVKHIPGAFGDREGTHCPKCDAVVIGRFGFRVTSYKLKDGKCASCGTEIPGVWGDGTAAVGRDGIPRPVWVA